MDLSRPSPTPARYTGIGLVIAVHLVAIWALNVAFLRPAPVAKTPTEFKPLPPDVHEQEPPPPPLRPKTPQLAEPEVIQVPVPIWHDAPAEPAMPLSVGPVHDEPGPVTRTAGGNAQPALPATKPAVSAPGAICSTMPRPELPALNWSGEAVLHALATVRGGHVVASEIRVAQGAVDAKTRRALQRSVESALAGYQCMGDAMFEQDFAFRLD